VVEQPQLFAQQEGAVEPLILALDLGERGELADRLVLGALSSDQRVLLTQRPSGVWERSCAVRSSRRTWSTARAPSRTTWKGSKQISASGTAWRSARWYSPLRSTETARIEF
jgi:hypothetical protein